LALQCLITFFESPLFGSAKVNSIVLFVDSQVALSWILSGNAPRKNVFVNNRLKEISEYLCKLRNIVAPVSFSYVPSSQNVADLVTKPCSAERFETDFELWMYGPSWLKLPSTEWPKGQLGCIPLSVRDSLVSAAVEPCITNSCPLDVKKFSSFSKLISFTSYVFKFINKCRKREDDPMDSAVGYLVKQMQESEFARELAYLKDPSSEEAPPLVTKLCLFIDEKGILRSRGRIGNNVELKYHVVNPVLMAKGHHVTKLVINYAHCKSMHMGLEATLNFLRMHGY
ncbi:MAG: hypothetical protein AAFY71_28800, partial [Bacteroidota bacterium]